MNDPNTSTNAKPPSKLPLFAAIIVLVVFFAWRTYRASVGFEEAPEFPAGGTWINADAGLKLADLRGKVVLIQFSFLGCGPCRMMDPYLHRWHDELKDEGLVIIEVDDGRADDLGTIRNWVERDKINFPVYYDTGGKMNGLYGVHSYPTRFLIGRDGKVIEKNGGWGGAAGIKEIEMGLHKALAAK